MALIVGIKQHDTLPQLRLRLTDTNYPNGVPLSGATEARLLVSKLGTLKVNAVMVIEDQVANPGVVHYDWLPANTDTVGDFNMEVQVTWATGGVETWPVSTDPAPAYMILRVQKDLGP